MRITIDIDPRQEGKFGDAVALYMLMFGLKEEMAQRHVVNACLQGHLDKFIESGESIKAKARTAGCTAAECFKRLVG